MPVYATGRIEPQNLDHLRQLSQRRHGDTLRALQATPLPATWDSRTLGWIGPIKNQLSCGSCWDFSGTCVVEVAYNKAGVGGGPDQFVLSEEYTLSCGNNGGCRGDDNTNVLQWAKQTGLPLSKDYGPYTASPGHCLFKQGMTLYKIDDWGFADSNGGQGVTPTDDIKRAIMQYGCVGCAIAADNALMNHPAGQVFDHTTSSRIDHDVVLVGWDDGKGKNGAWLLRNSWGTSWCDAGYCWIGYGVNQVGTEAVWAHINATAQPIDWGKI